MCDKIKQKKDFTVKRSKKGTEDSYLAALREALRKWELI